MWMSTQLQSKTTAVKFKLHFNWINIVVFGVQRRLKMKNHCDSRGV